MENRKTYLKYTKCPIPDPVHNSEVLVHPFIQKCLVSAYNVLVIALNMEDVKFKTLACERWMDNE